MDQTGGSAPPPPPGQQPPPPPPPPQQGWQSTPQQPGPPPPAGGQAGGMPTWTSNLTAQGTIPGPGGVSLADTPNRVIAAVIDFIILGVIGFIVGAIIHPILGERFGAGVFSFTVPSLLSSIVVAVVMFVIAGAYFVGMWTRMQGATLGMRVLKLQVRDSASGGPISQQQAINRFLVLGGPWALSFIYAWGGIGLIISVLVLVYYIYLLVTIAQSPTRQGFHDQYAKTVVAKVA